MITLRDLVGLDANPPNKRSRHSRLVKNGKLNKNIASVQKQLRSNTNTSKARKRISELCDSLLRQFLDDPDL